MRGESRFVMLLCALSVALSVSYALFIPPGERRDEAYHYQIIEYIAQTRQLPSRTAKMAEAFQPPLYYALMAPLKLAVAGPEARYDTLKPNIFIYGEHRLGVDPADNVNFYLHPKSHKLPTTDPLTVGIIAIRLLTAALGALSLLISYELVKRVWPGNPRRILLAMALLAGWQSLQCSFGSVNNDNAVILLSNLSLLLMVKQCQDGPAWRSSVFLGLALGGAMLSKASGLTLIVPFMTLVATSAWRATWRHSLVSAVVMLAVAGWWYVWSAVAYHDPFGLNAQYNLYPMLRARPDELLQQIDLARLSRVYSTLWLYFDYEGILMPRLFYAVFDLVAVAGVSGIALWLAQDWLSAKAAFKPVALAIGLFVVAMIMGVLYHAITNNAGNTGRHLLQASSAIAICAARGLDYWTPPRLRLPIGAWMSAALMAVSAVCLYGYYIPAFQVEPAPVRVENPLTIRFGDVAELIGVKEASVRATPGSEIIVTLYWRALAASSDDLIVLLNSDPPGILQRRSFPGAGKFLAGDWEPGDRWTDSYILTVSDTAKSGTRRLLVRLIHSDTGQLLASADGEGNLAIPIVMSVIVEGP